MNITRIHNATLIDGRGGPSISDACVLVEGDCIVAAGPSERIPPRSGAAEIDAQGGFILPGLIDTHVHLMVEHPIFTAVLNEPRSLAFYQSVTAMRHTLDAGITTVRDAGGADRGLKLAVDKGIVPGPRVQISVSILTITGGHADFTTMSGVNIMGNTTFFITCDGIDEVRRTVRKVLRDGAEVIKVCSTGGVLSPTDHPEFTQFSPEELAVVVQEARYRRGIPVMAHAQGAEGIKNAVRAGVRSIEHGVYLDDEAIELMLVQGTFLVPTLVAPIGILEIAERMGTIPDYALTKAREANLVHRESIAKAYRAGVKIAMGTDAGVIPHGTNLRELGLMRDIGMTPMDVLVATTSRAAECLGWDDRVGTIEPRKLADLVISRHDPIADIGSLADTRNIALVMKGGSVVKDHLSLNPRSRPAGVAL